MEEVQSNQDSPNPRAFTDMITGAVFANHGEAGLQRAGSSSPQAQWVPMIARRPSHSQVAPYDMVPSNRLGVGFLGNNNLLDDQSLTSAFGNMSLGFRAGTAGSPANPGSAVSRNGYHPEGVVISSADSAVNTLHQLGVAQDGLMRSSLRTNGFDHMNLNYRGRNVPMYTEIHGSDNFSWAPCSLPSPPPFDQNLFIDGWTQNHAPYQQMGSSFRWQDAERHSLLQPQYAFQHMPQVDGSGLWSRSNRQGVIHSSSLAATSSYPETHSVDHLGLGSSYTLCNDAVVPNENNQQSCRSNCYCENCEYCQIQQAEKFKHPYRLRCSSKGFLQPQIVDKVKMNRIIDRHGQNHNSNESLRFDCQNSLALSSLESEYELAMKTQLKQSSSDEVAGKIYVLAKDQNGCRFLQRIFTEGNQEDVKKVFDGIIKHIGELMVDQFGNYLVQKLLEECTDDQRMHIIYEITKRPGWLINISCNMHGTRAVQKVIEIINTPDEVSMVVAALSPGAITLMIDPNGSHVAQRCLQKLSPEYKAFLLNAAVKHYFELAQDRQGCCILQKCIVHANNEQKNQLLYNITSRTLDLSEHPYGNYVIQFILDLRIAWATDEILDKLEGNYRYLSMQKCSSNVVEKCLKETPEPKRMKIILELVNDPKLLSILLDQFGNYVIQTALQECEDAAVRAALIAAIRPHAAALRNNMFGKRILSKTYLKNRKP